MSLDQLGAVILPFLDDAIDDAISYLTEAQAYVRAWRDVLGV